MWSSPVAEAFADTNTPPKPSASAAFRYSAGMRSASPAANASAAMMAKAASAAHSEKASENLNTRAASSRLPSATPRVANVVTVGADGAFASP